MTRVLIDLLFEPGRHAALRGPLLGRLPALLPIAILGLGSIVASGGGEDPISDTNELLDGGIDLLGYTEVINDDDQITRIGFEPLGSDPGGVISDDLLVRETAEDLPGTLSIDSEVTLSGGFAVVFFAPWAPAHGSRVQKRLTLIP